VVPYAAVHNNGGSKMPKREYMGNRPERLDAIEEIIADAGLEILGRVPDA
jgi:phage gpG-like protein